MRLAFLFPVIFISNILYAQITIDDTQSIDQIMAKMQGDGVKITNITLHCPTDNNAKRPYGYFDDPLGVLGMRKGLILTNGSAQNAIGPNNDPRSSQANNYTDTTTHPNLQALVDEFQTLNDVCKVEFDATVYSDFLTFNYIFASEEYPEFVEYNDVFGFFISGPGITGVKNLATVPNNPSIPVSVSNVNHTIFYAGNTYYVSNGTGNTPFDNPDIQYDGYTTLFQAKTEVIPCETYHIVLAIADVSDNIVDSGVFIEEKSFNSKNAPKVKVEYEHERFPYAIEGCNNANLIFERDEATSFDVIYNLAFKGTATMGLDYSTIPNTVTFAAGETSTVIPVDIFTDAVNDHTENVAVIIRNTCPDAPDLDSISFEIREYFDYELEDMRKCGDNSLLINPDPILTDSIQWQTSPFLSCTSCLSPTTNISDDHVFNFEAWDLISGCRSFDSVQINYFDIEADFDFDWDECNTSVDVSFTDLSKNTTNYLYHFGDGNSSTEANPTHTYKNAINKREPQDFMVSMVVTDVNTSCADTIRKEISITNPFFVPNVVSPNDDLINDYFKIEGITPSCWKLEVYNRWGRLIISEYPVTDDLTLNQLSDGVYYYLLSNDSGDRSFKGNFQLVK